MENKNRPFFSIVIPTKNRPNFLKDAIMSVLLQKFDDYELIVSDNCNGEETLEVLRLHEGHPKISVIRPNCELNMINHWEFATKEATGKYVIVLADRKVLYKDALLKLSKVIKKHSEINVFSFGVQSFDEESGKMRWSKDVGKTSLFNNEDLINNFLSQNLYCNRSLDRYFPKTLNGCYSNDFANHVRRKHGNYFNISGVTTPDYSSFFINCALNTKSLYIGEKIILTQGENYSNGRLFGKGQYQTYIDGLNSTNLYDNVRIKAPMIYNLLIIDFLVIKAKVGGFLLQKEINKVNYYWVNYFEILIKLKSGMEKECETFFTERWEEAFKQDVNDLEVEKFKENVNKTFYKKDKTSFFEKIIRFKPHLRDFLSIRFSKRSIANKMFPFYFENVLEAAGHK